MDQKSLILEQSTKILGKITSDVRGYRSYQFYCLGPPIAFGPVEEFIKIATKDPYRYEAGESVLADWDSLIDVRFLHNG